MYLEDGIIGQRDHGLPVLAIRLPEPVIIKVPDLPPGPIPLPLLLLRREFPVTQAAAVPDAIGSRRRPPRYHAIIPDCVRRSNRFYPSMLHPRLSAHHTRAHTHPHARTRTHTHTHTPKVAGVIGAVHADHVFSGAVGKASLPQKGFLGLRRGGELCELFEEARVLPRLPLG